jgi:hypothetical protein
MNTFKIDSFDVKAYDGIIARGLSNGVGKRDGQMCIEAAICTVLGLPHGDDPGCVARSVRSFKIALNDKRWSSPEARAAGLRDLGLAQLGSLGVVNDKEFVTRLVKKEIQVLLPKMIRGMYPADTELLALALDCESHGTRTSAVALRDILYERRAAAYAAAAADAADAYAYAAAAADAADAYAYAYAYAAAAADEADAYAKRDEYLNLAASIALDVLRELSSPGVQLLDRMEAEG